MNALRLALSLGAPPRPPKREEPAPPRQDTRPPTLLELALPVPFFA